MGKVTAFEMDVITEKSGHVVAPIAPSVCTTPAAPAPVPVPYPVTGTSRGGIAGAPSRVKVCGAPVATVGSAIEACHGNEPGALKEVVSHNTGGPVPLLLGAPTVWMGGGMAGVTGSPVLANRSPGATSRTAPGPMGGAGMVPGAMVLGGGGDTGDGSGDGSGGDGGAGGGGRGGGKGGKRDQKHAPDGQDGQCAGGHPVDVVTGRAYTLPAVELELPGPLPLVFARVCSTSARERDVGLGFGWAHTWSWEIEVGRRALVVWSDEGIAVDFPRVEIGAEVVGPWGWTLRRERERFVLDTGDGVARVFAAVDEAGARWKLIELRDRNDNRIELTYEEGRLVEVIDSVGRTVRVLSTRQGRLALIQVCNARAQGRWIAAARYTYDEAGNLAAAFDAEGHATRYRYDDEHRLTRETERTGLAFHFVYDRAGRCVETWGEPAGRRDPSLAEDVPTKLADGTRARGIHHVRLDYGAGPYTEVADSREVRRHFGNRHGLVEKAVEGGDVEETAYDARGLTIARSDGEGGVIRFERDANGRVVREADPLGRVTTYRRDAYGLLIEVVDPAGGVTTIQRDERGNAIQEADPTGASTSTTYDARGRVTSVTSPTGGITRCTYDVEGNLRERVDPTGTRWCWSYDALGRCTVETDPLGHETRFTWTLRGDLASVIDGAGDVRRYTYDPERHLCEIQGPGRRTIGLAWGGYNRLVAKTNGAGETIRLRYDREGDLVEVVNAKGELHRIARDGAGRVVREETFDGRRIASRYDHAGRLVRSESAGEVTEYAYDAAGQLTARTLDDERVETFAYDARGELLSTSWPGGAITFDRDAAGRVRRETQSLGAEQHAVASLYDAAGERVRRFTSRGHVEHIERDAAGARRRTILDDVHDVRQTRDALGHEAVRALPAGGRVQSAYDANGRLVRRAATVAGSRRPVRFDDAAWTGAAAPSQPDRVTVEKEYRYDQGRELSDALDRRHGWLQYEHDAAGRLLSAVHEATGEEERFRYDAAGDHEAVGEVRVYGPGGRLLQRGDVTYQWDDAGRLREKHQGGEAWRYTWNAAGRLSAVELPGGRRVEYVYDPLGRRLEARTGEVISGAFTVRERTRFVWDGDTLAHAIRNRATAEGDAIVEERTFCFEDGGFVPWAHCETGADGYGWRRSAWAFYVNDPIGTPDALVGGDGAVLAEMDRRVWGKTEAVAGARASTPLRFQGQYDDGETGLFYNRFRYYDAEAGLYVSPDPIGMDGGPRAYGYGVSPLAWVDPLGLAVNTPNTGVVYLRIDPVTKREYVGRSQSKEAYRRRQKRHKQCNPNYRFFPLQANIAGPDLAQAEEDWIRAGGSPGRLENKIHAQSAKNYKGTVPYP